MSERGSTYFAFVEKWLEIERDRRAKQESRASAVVTSSAALVSLLAALVAVIIGQDYVLKTGTRGLVILALAVFVASGLCALAAGQLRSYRAPSVENLGEALGEKHWEDPESDARLAAAWMNLKALSTLRKGSNDGAWWLHWALRLQFAAMSVLGAAIAWELLRTL